MSAIGMHFAKDSLLHRLRVPNVRPTAPSGQRSGPPGREPARAQSLSPSSKISSAVLAALPAEMRQQLEEASPQFGASDPGNNHENFSIMLHAKLSTFYLPYSSHGGFGDKQLFSILNRVTRLFNLQLSLA
eukprot:scaffold38532_cov29-Prasinocladus_malaysianus.AAC.3